MEDIKKYESLIEEVGNLSTILDIEGSEIDSFISSLRNEELVRYFEQVKGGSKPEDALKDTFFSFKTFSDEILFKNLKSIPEAFESEHKGFIDYLIKNDRVEIKIEVKKWYERVEKAEKKKTIIKGIKKSLFDWKDHQIQVEKYLKSKGEYLFLTNFEEWYLFSRSYSLGKEFRYIKKYNIESVYKELNKFKDLWELIDRTEELNDKSILDENFLKDLDVWIDLFLKIKFQIEDDEKLKLVINIINKFIFIQTLDNFWIVPKDYLNIKWKTIEYEWNAKQKIRIIKKFLFEINEYFDEFYDTELFQHDTITNFLDSLVLTEENIGLLFTTIKDIIGIESDKAVWVRGIIHYNFRRINEDIFGKAYETILEKLKSTTREEEGIFYTNSDITNYIAKEIIENDFKTIVDVFLKSLEEEDYNNCDIHLTNLINYKFLDPSCGSGSFLIKVFREIFGHYSRIKAVLKRKNEEIFKGISNLQSIASLNLEKTKKLNRYSELFRVNNTREMILLIILRHLHGNDKDELALEISTINILLEAIKLAPEVFKFDVLPKDTNRILPNLRLNLTSGDSLVGLKINDEIEYISSMDSIKIKIKELFNLREKYHSSLDKVNYVADSQKVINKIESELKGKFREHCENYELKHDDILSVTTPLFWVAKHWSVFFDTEGNILPEDDRGYDAIIGNPPWISLSGPRDKDKEYKEKCETILKSSFEHVDQMFNTFALFLERSYNLLKNQKNLGFILPDIILLKNFPKIRKYLLDEYILKTIIHSGLAFEDASIDTVIILMEKSKNEKKENDIVIAMEFKNGEVLGHEIIKQSVFSTTIKNKFILTLTPSILEIIGKIEENCKKYSEIMETHEGIHSGNIRKKLFVETKEDTYHKKLIMAGDELQRYFINWAGKYVNYNRDIIDRSRGERAGLGQVRYFESEKILFQRTGDKIITAVDTNNHYVSNNIHISIKKEETEIELEFLSGILNSKLITLYFRTKQPRVGKLFSELKIEHINEFPIKNTIIKDPDSNLVGNIRNIKGYYILRDQFMNSWNAKIESATISTLKRIMTESDLRSQQGKHDEMVITNISSLNVDLAQKLTTWELDTGDLSLVIKSNDEIVFEVATRELRDNLYLSLLKLKNSSSKVEKFGDLISKCKIPVVTHNMVGETSNLIKKVETDIQENIKKINLDTDFSIVELDDQIKKTEEEIDIDVFKIYGLDDDDIKVWGSHKLINPEDSNLI